MTIFVFTGVSNIIKNLTPERLAAVVEEGYMGREVVVEIPKFTIERGLPLKPVRQKVFSIHKYKRNNISDISN